MRDLMEQGLLPRIIAGSSVGSIVAALTAVHTDDELKTMYSNMDTFNLSFFANDSTLQAIFHLFKKGSLQGACCPRLTVLPPSGCGVAVLAALPACMVAAPFVTCKMMRCLC